MNSDQLMLLKGNEILDLISGHEYQIVEVVKEAYKIHNDGDSKIPQSSFLRFPENDSDRIIALPSYLGGKFSVSGIKWISSFPHNIEKNMERASAALILNSMENGRPKAMMESSVISSKRTAAGAALAAHLLLEERELQSAGIIGCGLINFETVRFIMTVRPELKKLYIYDLSDERAEQFKQKCLELSDNVELIIVQDLKEVMPNAEVICIATTASVPHLYDISTCSSDCIILNTSLRDLSEDIILSSDNIVDDAEHVNRAQTSIHLATQKVGHNEFIRCTLGDIINGKTQSREKGKRAVYSAFGLGVLDIALGEYVFQLALKKGIGTVIDSFFPDNWLMRQEKKLQIVNQ